MRLPKTVTICGKPYKVRRDKKLYGGRAATGPQEMVVGTKCRKGRIFETFVHEVMEQTACERDFRYSQGGGSEDSVFVMNHKEFECFASDVATAIMPMMKK